MKTSTDTFSETFFLEIDEHIVLNPHKDGSDKNGKAAKAEPRDKIKHPAIFTLSDGYLSCGDWYIGCSDPEDEFSDAAPVCWTKDREAAADFEVLQLSADSTQIVTGGKLKFAYSPIDTSFLKALTRILWILFDSWRLVWYSGFPESIRYEASS